jgi:hypothetical protein
MLGDIGLDLVLAGVATATATVKKGPGSVAEAGRQRGRSLAIRLPRAGARR